MDPVSEAKVASALKQTNNNKAAGIMGLASKHQQLADIETIEVLTPLLNYNIRSRSISDVLKEGILTPIYKKGDPSDLGHYRGITVMLVYLKILEHLNTHHKAINKDSVKITKKLTPGMGGAVRKEMGKVLHTSD